MSRRPRTFAGIQLRQLRKRIGLSQSGLALQLGISPSYLSQLEHDDRPLTPKLVEHLARLFPLDWQDFPGDDTGHLAMALHEAMGDPIFAGSLEIEMIARLAEQQPIFARRFVELHEAFRRTNQRLEMVDEALDVDPHEGARLPWEEVRDWFHLSNNYVDPIDRAAEALSYSIAGTEQVASIDGLQHHLAQLHGIRVVLEPSATVRHYDPVEKKLVVDSGQPGTSIRFQIAYQVAAQTLAGNIRDIANAAKLRSSAARELLTIGLANYAAGAVLMPYGLFRRAAREIRHDVDRIAQLFQTSFEQTCHRLSTLQRDGERGVPMFFCRIDMAGNITKRHSATRLQFARFGGTCPLWIVHEAAVIPERILVQLAETPDGVRYVSIAKGLVKSSGRFDREPRRFAVALGCEVQHANEFVYGDSIDLGPKGAATPIGVSCRICPRANCDQRAYPPSDRPFAVNLFRRGVIPYDISR